jgi:opacity protein-like surface antigen
MTHAPCRHRRALVGCLTALAVLGAAHPAHAQRQAPSPIELGMDALLANTSYDRPASSSTTTFDLPLQAFRIGFELTPTISLEPTFGLRSVSGGGSFVTFDLGLPIELGTGGSPGSDYFLRPLIGLRSFRSDGESVTQTSLGVGLGVRIPIIPRLAARIEARYRRGLETGRFAAYNEIGLLGGLSFFTR